MLEVSQIASHATIFSVQDQCHVEREWVNRTWRCWCRSSLVAHCVLCGLQTHKVSEDGLEALSLPSACFGRNVCAWFR